jgi:DNA-3-methyladenine glycosylase
MPPPRRRLPRGLPPSFYARDAATVARDLVGKVLVREVDGTLRRARIVETEAYLGPHDLAAHSSRGRTARNAAMWGPPGRAYVYFVYGMHWMANVVTGARRKADRGQAVLLRAAEPLDGWAADLSGPARLAKAFGVTRADDHGDLARGPLRIVDGPAPPAIATDRRIGVDYAGDWAHAELRFLDPESPHVSRRPGRAQTRARPRPQPRKPGPRPSPRPQRPPP